MSAEEFDVGIYRARLEGLQHGLRSNGWQAALVMQPRDLFYYAGTAQPANLWVPDRGEPILFTRRAHEMAREATWIQRTEKASGFRQMGEKLRDHGMALPSGAVLAIETDALPYGLVEGLKRRMEGVELANLSRLVLRERLVKDEAEVPRIRASVGLWKWG